MDQNLLVVEGEVRNCAELGLGDRNHMIPEVAVAGLVQKHLLLEVGVARLVVEL